MTTVDVRDVFQLAGTTLEGRFTVERAIAEGGFGVVYLAQQAALDRPVALKVLKTPERFGDAAKQQFLASFAAEAKTIARITHPNIVHVHDFGVSIMPSGEIAAWMVLEWLVGETLEDELARRRGHGGRSPAECLEILRPVLSALAVVHAAGVAHRDLKPSNIMLVPGPDGAAPKLVDFGIAKIMDADEAPGSGQTHTRSGQVAFSPGYASPEQISQGRSGPWTDVHAMGLIATEMLTDSSPLEGDEVALIFQQIVHEVRPTPAKFGVAVGAWEGVLRRALAVSSQERYRNASELLHALEATVGESTATPATLRDLPPSHAMSGAPQTLAVMPTLPPRVAGDTMPLRSPRSHVTTGTPTSDGPTGMPARKASTALIYVAGGALALAAIAAVGYRASATHPEIVEPVAAASGSATSATSARGVSAAPATPTSDEPNRWIRVDPPRGQQVLLGVPDGTPVTVRGLRYARRLMAPAAPFDIQQHEVTWGEIGPWLTKNPSQKIAEPPGLPIEAAGRRLLPVTGIAWDSARLYCKSIGGTLPREDEWEYAARGPHLNAFPWGDDTIDLQRTNTLEGAGATLKPVMSTDQDQTPGPDATAIYDLMGNAREWTADLYREDTPPASADGELWVQSGNMSWRAVRGLPLEEKPQHGLDSYTAAYRTEMCGSGTCPNGTEQRRQFVGFRCVRRALPGGSGTSGSSPAPANP